MKEQAMTETQKAIEAEYWQYTRIQDNFGYVEIGWSEIRAYEMAAYIAGRSASDEAKDGRIRALENEVADLKRQLEKYETSRYDKDDFDGKRDPWDDLGKWANENTF